MKKPELISIIILFIFSYTLGWVSCGTWHMDDKQKGALEVYKGNTKLKYSVIDSIVVDSCVVFLNEKY